MTAERRDRWVDRALAAGLLIACEIEIVAHEVRSEHWHYADLVVGVLATAAMTAPLLWRRRAPLATTGVELAALVVLLSVVRNDRAMLNVPQLLLFVPPYSVAVLEGRQRAVAGLGVCVAGVVALNLISPDGVTSWVFCLVATSASWGVGRFTRTQRTMAAELRRTSDQISVEAESRERLAIAEQRTLIARELQTLVADNVSSMIVQAQATKLFLESDVGRADEAMALIEQTGRAALSEMRLILGVLRRADQPADLAPQPGIGQLPALVDAARAAQRHISLRVDGEPGPLPASADLGMYRMLEDAITIDPSAALEIALVFGADSIDLRVTASARHLDWPTIAMRERVALCEGELEVLAEDDHETLAIRLPRVLRGVLA